MKRLTPLLVLFAMLCSAPAFAQADSPMVGAWDAVSQGGQEFPPGFSMWVENRADGTGTLHIGSGPDAEEHPYTWSHDQAAGTCTIVADGETMVYKVEIEGDTATFTNPDDAEDTMVMRRRSE